MRRFSHPEPPMSTAAIRSPRDRVELLLPTKNRRVRGLPDEATGFMLGCEIPPPAFLAYRDAPIDTDPRDRGRRPASPNRHDRHPSGLSNPPLVPRRLRSRPMGRYDRRQLLARAKDMRKTALIRPLLALLVVLCCVPALTRFRQFAGPRQRKSASCRARAVSAGKV